jgi:hypothetical protein
MTIDKSAEEVVVKAEKYSLNFSLKKPYVTVKDSLDKEWTRLFLGANVHTLQGLDGMCGSGVVSEKEAEGIKQIVIEIESNIWEREELVFELEEDSFSSYVAVRGKGNITDVQLFGGYMNNSVIGTGFYRSEAMFKSVFTPSPTMSERWVTPVHQHAEIGIMGSSYPGQGKWFFTPAPFCYGFSFSEVPSEMSVIPESNSWMMAGILARKGEYNFTSYKYLGDDNSFLFNLNYEGYIAVDGEFVSPKFSFFIEENNPYTGLERYGRELTTFSKLPEQNAQHSWWKRPIFCGWGAQCYLEEAGRGKTKDLAKEDVYDEFIQILDQKRINPGIITIDDKWQKEYGYGVADEEKWPDLKKWIEKIHNRKQKVLLWWKAWDAEGLSSDLCITNKNGSILCVDPSNPAYERLLRQQVQFMLGREGYDADGFKIDFTGRAPVGPGLKKFGDIWGVELLHKLLFIIYDEAKKVKPDALIVTHTPNPYFQDVTDMVRLNDINTGAPVVAQMLHRAKIAKAVCPDHLIDTDNWIMPDIFQWRDYLNVQNDIGVPCLYYTTHIKTDQALTEEDYEKIRSSWAEYESRELVS